MSEITHRQKKILFKVIEEYIKTAQPVSSLRLNQKYNFKLSSATIRNEMLELTKKGFLIHPYSSAGKVPSNKGYRLFIEEWIGKLRPEKNLLKNFEEISSYLDDLLEFSQKLTYLLNKFASGLVLNYLFDKGLLWEEGWNQILLEPEFASQRCLKNFTRLIFKLESEIHELFENEPLQSLKVFVGKENPIFHCDDFSIIVSKVKIPKTKKGACLLVVGPKRMPYRQNLKTIYTLLDFVQKI